MVLNMRADVIVVGAGTVGAAVAYGLASRGLRVIVLDGADHDSRAAAANFGLIWLQGKGLRMPEYQSLSRASVDLWPGFDRELGDISDTKLDFEHNGGLSFCLGDEAFERRRHELQRLHNVLGGRPDWEMLTRRELERLLPTVQLGADVTGASYGHSDGQVNPLKLLSALLSAIRRLGGTVVHGSPVASVEADHGGFTAKSGAATYHADRIVLCAGLGSEALARQLGIEVRLRPQRGQIQVTERIAPVLPLPTISIRQTAEGTMMIGTTHEEVGHDSGTTAQAAARLSERALEVMPGLRNVRLIRQWAGLRVMTPDSYPIYDESPSHPGAFVALCHSGITLAPLHAKLLASAILDGGLPAALAPFHSGRFDVPHAA